MMAKVALRAVALAAFINAVPAAGAGVSADAQLGESSLLHSSSKEAFEERARSMSTTKAVQLFDQQVQAPKALRSFIQEKLGHVLRRGKRNFRSRSRGGHRQGPAGGEHLESARNMLNHMIEEAKQKLDLEQVKCSEFQSKHGEQMEESRQDMAMYNGQSAQARSLVLSAQADMERFDLKLPQIQEELGVHTSKCAVDVQAIEQQLLVTRDDLGVMERIMNATECNEGGASLIQLVRCHDRRGHSSFITFGASELQKTVGALRSDVAKRALQDGLGPLYRQAVVSSQPAVLLEMDESHRRHVHPRRHTLSALNVRQEPQAVGEPVVVETAPAVEVSDEPFHVREQQRKCSARDNPDCVLMRDKLMQIMTNIADKEDGMKRDLSKLQGKCENLRLNYEAQIADIEARFKDSQTRLAEGTKAQNENEEQSRLKGIQLEDLNKDFAETMLQCGSNIKQFENEGCSITKIRTEIYKVEGVDVHIQDCEASAWLADECPVTCGGATQRLSRSVVAQASGGGASCPPLEMMRRCNEQECPIDCAMADWTGWSSCTGSCGGGVRQRTRAVNNEPRYGGDPCGETSESEVCNVQSCDKDCSLSDWTTWSQCSKACGSGLEERMRTVTEVEVGQGSCPAPGSEDRVEYRPCNAHPCVVAEGAETLRCTSKIDLVLMVDGSGSMGGFGWSRLVSSLDTLIGSLEGGPEGVRLAVLLFSGPTTWNVFRRCTQGPRPWEAAPDMEADCKMQWVTRFTEDMAAARAAVNAAAWPQGQTLTSMALSTIEAELPNGRRDAQTVVAVITDGRPASPERTFQAAKSIREKARLIWIPVTTYAPIEGIEDWASTPVHENVIRVPDFSTLALPETISSLVADICPVVS